MQMQEAAIEKIELIFEKEKALNRINKKQREHGLTIIVNEKKNT